MFRVLAGTVAVGVALVSCSPETTAGSAPPAARADGATPTATHLERPPTRRRPLVQGALGVIERKAARAVRDLKAAGYWRRLVGHLYAVQITVAHGRRYIPDDGHLADATLVWVRDEWGRGFRCNVRFYAASVRADLRRQRRYLQLGLLPGPVPTLRQLWASVLAHELSHCGRKGTRDEATASRHERQAFDALRGKGIE